nr:DUF5688 family protein [Eubacterium sp.]
TKNNGVRRQGIIINNNTVFSPIIYVDELIEQGFDAEDIAIKVLERYKEAKENEVPMDVQELSDFEELKKRICYRLINMKANEKLLSGIPYDQINEDLALIYFLNLGDCASITITDNLLKSWNVDADALFDIAKKNTPELCPPEIKSLTDVIIDLMGDEFESMKIQLGKTDLPDEEFRTFLKTDVIGDQIPLFVLSTNRSYGATALIYEDMMKIIQERFGDVYVIPSSVHEILFASAETLRENGLHVSDLKNIVVQVNESVVSPEDWLSDNVYLINEHGLFMAEDNHEVTLDTDER